MFFVRKFLNNLNVIKVKVCFFGLELTYKRGVNKLSANLITYLVKNSDIDEVFVVCDGVDDDVYKSLKHKKIHLVYTGQVKRSDVLRIFVRNIRYLQLPNELKKSDIFHVLDDRALPLGYPNVKPLIVTIHNAMTYEFIQVLNTIELEGINGLPSAADLHLPQMFLEFASAKRAKRIIVNSPIIAQKLTNMYGNILASKIRIIPPGFDKEKFNPYCQSKSEAKDFLKLDPSSKVLLHVGGCEERKGLPYLLHALNYMQRTGQLERHNILLLVLGKVERKWKQLMPHVEKHIVELPYVPEDILPTLYRAADVVVMPSVTEGWGMVLVEAIACGTCVIASQNVPSAWALKDLDVVQIENEVDDPGRLTNSILDVIKNDSFNAKDWDEIFSSLARKFSWENYAKRHIDVYKEFT